MVTLAIIIAATTFPATAIAHLHSFTKNRHLEQNFCNEFPQKISSAVAAVESASAAVAAAAEALKEAELELNDVMKKGTGVCFEIFEPTEHPSGPPDGPIGEEEESVSPSAVPSTEPNEDLSAIPTYQPTTTPTDKEENASLSVAPSVPPSAAATNEPSKTPSGGAQETVSPTAIPSTEPNEDSSRVPTYKPTATPTDKEETASLSAAPSAPPSEASTNEPSKIPSGGVQETASPSAIPSAKTSAAPSPDPNIELLDDGPCTICGPNGPADPGRLVVPSFTCGMLSEFIPSFLNATSSQCTFYRAIGDHACGCTDGGDIPGCEGILERCPSGEVFDLNGVIIYEDTNTTLDCGGALFAIATADEQGGTSTLSCPEDEGPILEACCVDGPGPAPSSLPSTSVMPSVSDSPTIAPSISHSPMSEPSSEPTAIPSGAPSSTPSIYGCRTKRLVVTHLCSMPDLDGGDSDVEMAIRLEVDGTQVWPKDAVRDCPDGRFYGDEWCKVWDEDVTNGCYELDVDATAEVVLHTHPLEEEILLTLFEDDFFFDDSVTFSLPVDAIYDYERCGVDTFNATTYQNPNSHIVVRVISEIRVPTSEPSGWPTMIPSVIPSAQPSHPTPLPSNVPTNIPSVVPSQSPTSQCRIDTDSVEVGLADATDQLLAVNEIFQFGANNNGGRMVTEQDNGERRLAWPLMSTGIKAFRTAFSVTKKKAGDQGPLSTVADICTIGSTLFSVFGLGGGEPPDPYADEFRRIFERFDQIDAKLDDISNSIETGFQKMEIVIKQQFANVFLDDVIKERLAKLEDNYRAYLNQDHIAETRETYEMIFRNNCQNDSPYTILKSLYGHSCRDCDLLDGRFNQYILDTFVDLAIGKFDDVGQRVLWFRSSFTTMMLGSATKSMFLHAVCLYQPRDVCQNEDPVWRDRLDDMGNALEQMADSLSAAEDRVKCRRKSVRITHMCNLPDLDPDIIIGDDDMDLRLEIEGERYWPLSIDDCTDNLGMFNNACLIKDVKLVNGACYHLERSTYYDFSAGQRLDITIWDEDFASFDESLYFRAQSADWYDDMSCDDRDIIINGEEGSYLKLNIKSSVINDPWGGS